MTKKHHSRDDYFLTNIDKRTIENTKFRDVLFTSTYSQLVLMSLKPLECIELEKHKSDQFFRIEKGRGIVVISKTKNLDNCVSLNFKSGDSISIPSNTYHNIINTSKKRDLKLYTVYSPAQHKFNETISRKKT